MIVDILQKWGFQDSTWENRKFQVMLELLFKKRTLHTELSEYLLSTKPSILVEGNDRNDTYRGYSDATEHNYLGKILMYIRDEILTH